MEFRDWLDFGLFLIAATGLYFSLRKVRVEEGSSVITAQSSTVTDALKLVESYKTELSRCQDEAKRERADHIISVETLTQKHTEELTVLTTQHNAQIADLQKQIDAQNKTIQRQSNEITQLKAQIGAA